MKPLYRFSLNIDTGEIKRNVIKDYDFIENRPWTSGYKEESYYRFRLNGTYFYAYIKDFDHYVNRRVYSWNDDIESAKQIIAKSLLDNIEQLEAKARRCTHTLNMMRGRE